jgi:hypothetical protein
MQQKIPRRNDPLGDALNEGESSRTALYSLLKTDAREGENLMCPACITTLVLLVAGAATTGGLTTLVINKRSAAASLEADRPENLKENNPGGK